MIIDCTECDMYQTEHCRDCFVMAVLNRNDSSALSIDEEHSKAIGRLQDAGLAPVLRFTRKAG